MADTLIYNELSNQLDARTFNEYGALSLDTGMRG